MKELVFPPEFKSIVLSKELSDFFYKSAKYAHIDKNSEISTANIAFTIIADENQNIVISTLEAMNVDINIFFESLKEVRGADKKQNTSNISISDELKQIITTSEKKTKKTKNEYGVVELFFALLKSKNSISQILIDNAIDYFVFKETYEEIAEFFDAEQQKYEPEFVMVQNKNENSNSNLNVIELFTTNLNQEYLNGNISECIGREDEIEILERVLNRKNKRNAILVGKAGVGKTNIIEGLVKKIVEKNISESLQDKIILSLNINDLEAGTAWRGQLEERIKILTSYLTENPNIILFIDEIHSIIGTGRATNADLSNALKPFLSKGKIQIIGATTNEEFKSYIETNRAFTRRFFVQYVDELDKHNSLIILKKIKKSYEELHNVTYSDEILNTIVDFCDEYLKNKTFPDKCIEIMDDLGASMRVKQRVNKEIISINKEINALTLTKKYVIQNKKYEESEQLLLAEKNLKEKLKDSSSVKKIGKKQKITSEMFLNYIKHSYKIENFDTNFEIQLDLAEENIKNNLFGQDEIVENVINNIRTKKLFEDYSSPTVLFFVGESGVGKTFLAEQLAKNIYQNKIKIINCEMYKEKHAVANLIGSPKGYVDSDKGSELFEYIKHNPESIVLFDEIEKAHPDFYDILLTFLEKGLLTDKDGTIIDARRCLMIFTSNVGNETLKITPIGFGAVRNNNQVFEKSINKQFRQEFINRIDGIYYFNSINNYENVLNLEFEKIQNFMKNKNIKIQLSSETRTKIIDSCKNGGAIKELKRAITKNIKEVIAKKYKKEKVLII